jgi:integrase
VVSICQAADARSVRRSDEALNAAKLGEVVELYLKRHSKPGSYWIEIRRKFDVEIIPELGKDTPVTEITKSDLRALIEAKQDKNWHGAARYLFATLRPFFKWCAERDLISKSPLEDISPPKPLASRDRVLTDAEIVTFWKATESDPLFGPFYRLLLLTAQRREEVGGMQWQEVDRVTSTWTIPKQRTKNAKEHVVHLSPQALAVLDALPRQERGYVFTTTGTTPISGYGKAKARLDGVMGELPEWRVHDLRRTAASGMAALGFQPHIIERVLNHVSGATGGLVGVYQRFEYLEERQRALEAWANHVKTLCSGCRETRMLKE